MFDQVTLFMVFLMLCFAGIAAMFYFILRGLDELSRELKGERSQLIGLLQSMEASVDILVKVAQLSVRGQASASQAAAPKAASLAGSVPTSPASQHFTAPQPVADQQPAAPQTISLAETRAAQNKAARAAAGLNLNYQDEKFQSSGNEETVFEDTAGSGIPSLSLGAQQNMASGAKRTSSPGLSLKK